MSSTKVDKKGSAPARPLPARSRILIVRDQQVMLDADLAELYGVETRTLLQQVKRNSRRFPDDFMFRLFATELEALRSQFVMSKNPGRGGRRTRPYAFTEQGVAMLSSVLRSERAVVVNIEIMRAFVEMRRTASSYAKLAMRMDELERTTAGKLGEHEQHLAAIFKALKQLMASPPRRRHPVGFSPPEEK